MSAPSAQKLPVQPPPKSSASPQPAQPEVELTGVENGSAAPKVPLEEDIMQCARIGAIEHIQKMLESKKVDPKYADEEGITPLHWAAINNQYAVCKYLIEQGADVNQKGGESGATAAMWAAQRCHFYIVHLLLENGADPLAQDIQGYNILHLATIDGNALMLVLLLHQNIPVDAPDPQGHTSLMWAGYKGWPALTDILLRWGASVNAIDDNGFTPLHWALVKGTKPCIERLIEYGADRFAKTNEGKTPATVAEEMNSKPQFHRALADQGYGPDGNLRVLPLGLAPLLRDRSKMSKFFFLYPFLIIFVGLYILSHYTIYIAVPLAFAAAFGMQWGAQFLGNRGPPQFRQIHKTPYLAGVFSGTLFWIGVDFVTAVLPATFSRNPFISVSFIILYGLTAYFYTLSATEDPGWIPKLSSRNQQRAVISELFSLWKFDEDNFCLQCMIRKPLRSKHCRRCGRCVSKQDHHCPWINNCVANNNHRHFFLYIIAMAFGIAAFTNLVVVYLFSLPAPPKSESDSCHILTPAICSYTLRDPWTVALTIWALLQLVWIFMLVVVQSVQIAKNMTTFENMKRHSHNDANPHLPLHRPRHPITQGHSHATDGLNDTAASSTRLHPAPRREGCWTKWKRTIGLDVFLATASDASHGKMKDRGNPFSRGLIGNCKDFWCDPAPVFGKRVNGESYLGGEVVDYSRLYDVPMRLRRAGGMRYESVATAGDDDEV
jgi:palmitoyltransferase ZDHHC13/17